MDDLRVWLKEVEACGKLKTVDGADPHLEIGVITELNCRRRGPALLFDNIRGFPKGRRLLTGALLDAERLGLALGYRDLRSDQDLVSCLEGKMTEYELRSSKFRPRETSAGAVFENRLYGDDINLLTFPAPKWHEHDGGSSNAKGGI